MITILQGDCRDVLKTLPDCSVHCCVTSPPYFGLRDYGCAGQIGLESTPDAYVAELVAVFREVKRVLRDDGVLFLNLGDSYYHTNPSGPQGKTGDRASRTFTAAGAGGQRVQSCDTSGKAGQGLQGRGSSSQSRHDEHTDAWWSRIDDTDCRLAHEQAAELFRQILASMEELRDRLPIVDSVARQQIWQCVAAMRDQAQIAIHAAERLLSFPASMIAGCAPQLQDGLTPMDTLSVFLSSLQTFAACALRCAGTSGEPEGTEHGTAGNALLFAELAHHIRCTSAYCSLVVSWLNTPYVQAQCTTGAGWSQALKPKDLIGIPWRVAFALQADGWYLRQDIIWCLSGGTRVYARTQKGEMPTTIKDIARLDPATVQLWNGEKWTQLLGMSQSSRNADELEVTLRSGEKIACTPTHKFPTERGLLTADELRPGDRLIRTTLPPPSAPLDSHHMTDDAAWFAGLYLAEGSRSGHTLQIAGHVKESERWERVKAIAAAYGGSATRTIDGNRMDIRVYGKMLHALVDMLVSGTNAKTKHLNPRCWQYSNHFLHALLQGYLSGDGHYDPKNARWRLVFTRNDALAADMRTLAARLDAHLVLNQSHAILAGKRFPIYRGELRFERSGHWNQKHTEEIVSIGKARCRVVYDLGVEDEPHLFALASGILTHNSKPNPMPESVRDRCTKAHEYIFLLAKSPRYYYDAEAVKEPGQDWGQRKRKDGSAFVDGTPGRARQSGGKNCDFSNGRNRRSVWTVTTKPYREAHFATFPPDLIQPCIRAGCPAGGTVLDPFGGSGTTGEVAASEGRKAILIELNPEYVKLAKNRGGLFVHSN